MPGEECGEEQQRPDHGAPALVQRDRADPQEHGEREHESCGEEPRVEAERPAVEEHVARGAENDGGEDQTDRGALAPRHRSDALTAWLATY